VQRALGSDYRVNYHGTNIVTPRRMNVLIDGYSVYGSAVSRVEWALLPVAMEDVDRIEVTRGPDSSAYGPNSMSSVINILTKRPKDVESAMASVSVGSHGAVEVVARGARQVGAATQVSLTAQTERNSGYDFGNTPNGGHDSVREKRLNLRAQTEIDRWTSMELQLSHVDTDRQEWYSGDGWATSLPDLHRVDTQLNARWTHALSGSHELQVKALAQSTLSRQSWSTCWPLLVLLPAVKAITDAHPEIAAYISHTGDFVGALQSPLLTPTERASLNTALFMIGGLQAAQQPVCGVGNMDYDESRAQVELQDTYVVSDQLRFVSGGGFRSQRADSQVYLGGKADNVVRWLFAHGEYRATDALTLNAGGYAESNSLGTRSFSPRLAANYKLSDEQTLRAVYSRGTRSPDLLESRGNWAPVLKQINNSLVPSGEATTITVLQGNPQLKEERNTAVEVGYLVAVRRWGMVMDTRAFSERMSKLISSFTTITQLYPDNTGSVRLDGVETQANWELGSDWSAFLNYAYLVNHDSTSVTERTQWSRHSGSIGLSHAFSEQWRGSMATFMSSGNGQAERGYARTDLTLIHPFKLGAQAATATWGLSYLHTPTVSSYLSRSGAFTSTYNQRLGLYGKLRVAF
jgi:iron complex outermembrane receptor protein